MAKTRFIILGTLLMVALVSLNSTEGGKIENNIKQEHI